jgi:membrane protein DedA with SNARE-associated domain
MNYGHFVLAIFLGRLARFGILSLLTIRYGTNVVAAVGALFKTHLHWVLGIAGLAAGVWFFLHIRKRNRRAESA